MLYPFNALLARMKYITRWSLMHSTRAESLSEHTCDTALLAHTLQAELPLPVPKQVQAFHTLTHQRAWCSGQERTPLRQGFPISLFAGL